VTCNPTVSGNATKPLAARDGVVRPSPRYIPNFERGSNAVHYEGSGQLEPLTLSRLELAGRLMSAQEDERARIARELHDDIGQSLALCGAQMKMARLLLGGISLEADTALESLSTKIVSIGRKISSLSHQLHSPELEYLGLVIAAKALCREFSVHCQMEITFVCKKILKDVPGNIALALFRVLQEGLHNAEKYRGSEKVVVTLSYAGNTLHLSIVDDGVGFDVDGAFERGGLGLTSMHERLRLLGGSFEIRSRRGGGTKIEAYVSLISVGRPLRC
jgi:signal transduction histidine kinase